MTYSALYVHHMDAESHRRIATELGFEFLTPQAAALVFQKSLESVRVRGREGKLGREICVDLGNPTYVYPVKGCKRFWGVWDPVALAGMRAHSLPIILPSWGDLESIPAAILHPSPVISIGARRDTGPEETS